MFKCPECETDEILIRHKETMVSYYTATIDDKGVLSANDLVGQSPIESIRADVVCRYCYLTLSVPDGVEVDV